MGLCACRQNVALEPPQVAVEQAIACLCFAGEHAKRSVVHEGLPCFNMLDSDEQACASATARVASARDGFSGVDVRVALVGSNRPSAGVLSDMFLPVPDWPQNDTNLALIPPLIAVRVTAVTIASKAAPRGSPTAPIPRRSCT